MPLHNLSLIFIGMKQIFELKIGGLVKYDFFKLVNFGFSILKKLLDLAHENLVN